MAEEQVPALSSLNMRLRDDFVADCQGGVNRWNKVIEKAGIPFRLALPHVAFNRKIGEFSRIEADPEGRAIPAEQWVANRDRWLPSTEDNLYIVSLMRPMDGAGKFASWIAPPKVGIDNRPGDFEYVTLWD